MAYTDDQLWEMDDAELAKAFRDAKIEEASPEVDIDVGENDEETEEVEVLDLEQPLEDSGDDTTSDDEEEVEVDTDDESTDEESTEDSEVDEDQPEEVETETQDEEEDKPVQRRKYKANGKDFEFTDEEIFQQFGQVFGQAMNYTQKMQQIKPWRKTIDAIEQAKLTHDDVNLAIDVLSGNKDAIAAVLKRTGVDALELDTESTGYKPTDYGRNDTELSIKDIVEEIKGDKEYAVTYDVLERQWDDKSRVTFVENPELIKQLHTDVKNGMFDIIAPMANKLKVYDGGKNSDIEYYGMAAQQYFADQAKDSARISAQEARKATAEQARVAKETVTKVKTEQQKREAVKTDSAKRKAAAPTAKVSGAKKSIDYLDASDEAFEEFYRRIQDSY